MGVEVAEAAARAAVIALSDVDYRTNKKSFSSLVIDSIHQGMLASHYKFSSNV